MCVNYFHSLLVSYSDHESLLVFPRTQLYYLAPEIMQCISSYRDPGILGDVYPFTEHSDIYCYGLVVDYACSCVLNETRHYNTRTKLFVRVDNFSCIECAL